MAKVVPALSGIQPVLAFLGEPFVALTIAVISAMFLLGYFEDGTPICGLPGCVMYAGATIFDLALPRIAAGVELTRRDFAVMGEGGLCLGCKPCRYPLCPFGK